MTKLLDNICKIRDLMSSRDYDKYKFHIMQILQLTDEIHRQVAKKTKNYRHELEFTSQDLRELAKDIQNRLDCWSKEMNPEENIKTLLATIKDNRIDLESYYDKVSSIMHARAEVTHALTGLLTIAEYYGAHLYILEEASNDKFAINYTERFE